MIPWEVSMKFEQFKHCFKFLQIMENTMLAVIISQRQHSGLPKFENLKSCQKIVQNSLKLPNLS
jgi:hypothetical protein